MALTKFQLALFCLTVSLLSVAALDTVLDNFDIDGLDDDVDFEFRGPADLKRCDKMIENQQKLMKKCIDKGD